ncbi:uncharacterized protein L201_007428 [Kwoniella dendrophila CBS 6074]|uniref:Uncharacterized protein n=1 Tax=Kwoniella dendrophila CBS 6074 TaxID=1295534 RepID=A0AAX4K4D0_9TREE
MPNVVPLDLCDEEGKLSDFKLGHFLRNLKPRSLQVEWYSGEDILTRECISEIAGVLRQTGVQPESQPEKQRPVNRAESYHPQLSLVEKQYLDTALAINTKMLEVWRPQLVAFTLRASHMLLDNELRKSINQGALRHFDYHVICPSRKATKIRDIRQPVCKSPIPPIEGLRSIDNILMWDLRWREPKYVRRGIKRKAEEKGETYRWRDHIPPSPINWTVYACFDLWQKQKDKGHFKGEGKTIPWKGRGDEIDQALGDFIIDKSINWIKPYNWIDKSEKENFEDMIKFVVGRKNDSQKKHKNHKGINNLLLNLTEKQFMVDENICKARILEVRLRGGNDKNRTMNEEMAAINQAYSKQEEFNELYIKNWLFVMEEDEKKALIKKLEKKYGAKNLYTNMNCPLYHPAQEGVKFMIEPTTM